VAKIKRINAPKKKISEREDGLNPLLIMALNLTLLLILTLSFGLENFFYFKNRLRLMSSLVVAEEKAVTKSSLSQSKLNEFDEAYQSAVQNINGYLKNPVENGRALNIAKAQLNIAMKLIDSQGYDKLKEALQGLMKKVDDYQKEEAVKESAEESL
jgi:hypothetical protein